ncbi:hypothetical protein [Brevibacillus parabrevis]|uniref:hypothetical protein n=1 Tax=Brevibacillus parabrevis TaxID=54914 RepID=UPI002E1D9EFD|nr:hypothetical protein [Brevibacillus parabrevis]
MMNPMSALLSALFELLGKDPLIFFCVTLLFGILIWLYRICSHQLREAKEKSVEEITRKITLYTELLYSIKLHLSSESSTTFESMMKKTAEASSLLKTNLLKKMNTYYTLKTNWTLSEVSNELDKEIISLKGKLKRIKPTDYEFDGPFGKLNYFMSILSYVISPFLLSLLIIAILCLVAFWVYLLLINPSNLGKFLIFTIGFSLYTWVLVLIGDLHIISEESFNYFHVRTWLRIVLSIVVWGSPALFIIFEEYGGIFVLILNLFFLYFVLPQSRKTKK